MPKVSPSLQIERNAREYHRKQHRQHLNQRPWHEAHPVDVTPAAAAMLAEPAADRDKDRSGCTAP